MENSNILREGGPETLSWDLRRPRAQAAMIDAGQRDAAEQLQRAALARASPGPPGAFKRPRRSPP